MFKSQEKARELKRFGSLAFSDLGLIIARNFLDYNREVHLFFMIL